jgi:hypothetical protein
VIGTVTLEGNIPSAGEVGTWNLEVEIPESALAGDLFLLARVDPGNQLTERKEGNNLASSDAADIHIREWSLNLNMNGDGLTGRDDTRIRYTDGSRVNLVAFESKRIEFLGWEGNEDGGLRQLTLTMDGNKDLTVGFNRYNLLDVMVEGGGRVTVQGETSRFDATETAQLEAVGNPGWTFHGWSGAVEGHTPTASVPMTEDRQVTATFSQSFAQWVALTLPEHTGADVAWDGNPDGDAANNLQEYLGGGNPLQADDTRSRVETLKTPQGLVVRYWRKKGVLEGRLELKMTGDLQGEWTQIQGYSRILEETGEAQYIEAEIPAKDFDVIFLKLEYTREPF